MKKLVILGAGSAGTMMANKMRRDLDNDWSITLIDKDNVHYYQPGFLFIPFGIYNKSDVIKPKGDFFPAGVKVIYQEIDRIEGDENPAPADQRVPMSANEDGMYHRHIYRNSPAIQPETPAWSPGSIFLTKRLESCTPRSRLPFFQFPAQQYGAMNG